MLKLSLCALTLNLRDRVLGEVEIGLLLSQRGPLQANALETVCPTRGFIVLVQAAGHDQLMDILLIGWWWDHWKSASSGFWFQPIWGGVVALSPVWLFGTLWTISHQVPLSVKFSRQEYWSGLPFLTPRDLLNTGIEPECLASPAMAGRFSYHWATWEACAYGQHTVFSLLEGVSPSVQQLKRHGSESCL